MTTVQRWGRRESVIWPPRGFYYTYGAICLAIVATGFLVYVHFEFALSSLQQYYLPYYLRTETAGFTHRTSSINSCTLAMENHARGSRSMPMFDQARHHRCQADRYPSCSQQERSRRASATSLVSRCARMRIRDCTPGLLTGYTPTRPPVGSSPRRFFAGSWHSSCSYHSPFARTSGGAKNFVMDGG